MGDLDRDQALEWVLSKLSARKTIAPKPIITAEKKKSELQATKASEMDLWHTWKNNGYKPKDLDPLLTSLKPLILKRSTLFTRAEVPNAAVDFEHKKHVVKALKTYDPSKGKLGTWLTKNMQKAGRYVEKHKNFARIPENISQHIGSFNAVKAELTDTLGHEPDSHTLHDHFLTTSHPTLGKLSMKDITRLNREQRKGFLEGKDRESISTMNMDARDKEVVHLIYHQLTPPERAVHEYCFGLYGKPKIESSGQIAKKLGWDVSKVSKIKTSIFKKMEPHLEP